MTRNCKLFFLVMLNSLFVINAKAQVTVDVLTVAGGGGGGNRHGGGGGAGGLQLVNGQSITNGQNYTITVGAGGTGSSGASTGNKGGNSSFGTLITSEGGGGGGSNASNGASGGSGGGGSNGTFGGNGATGQGNKGGDQNNGNGCCNGYGNGGGGAGAAGQNSAAAAGSNGGVGLQVTITGSSVYYSGGGGGGHLNTSLSSYLGGLGGGGNGGNSTTLTGSNASANTGGGGGGGGATGSTSGSGGSGGSGIVVVRYASKIRMSTGGDTSSYTGNGTNGTSGVRYQVHIFRSNGIFRYNELITTQPSTSSQSMCVSGTSTALTVVATGTTKTFQWYSNSSNSNSGGTLISGATAASYTPPTNVAGTRYYYCYVTSTTSGVTTNQTSNVSGAINVGTVAGSISGANSVNSGTNSTTLTLSGHTGTIQWQSSTNGTTFGTASGTSTNTTYTATNLTATTYYRAVVTNGSCGSLNTASATILVLPSTTPNSTSMSITGTNTTNAMSSNVVTVVDAGIVITGTGNISGFTVSISENYSTGDVLGYSGSLPSGITASAFSTTSRSIVFKGNATAATWQTFLRTVTLRSTSGTCNPVQRKVTFSVSSNFFNFFNGHYYEYVSAGRIWSSAKTNAESKTFFGRQGYLATISSAEENAYISKLIGQNSWLGATDNYLEINRAVGYSKYANQSAAEGKYHWVSGPEKGVQISNGSSSITGRYLRWAGGEPNNYNTGFKDKSLNLFGEHYLHIYSSSSTWNDFPDDRSLGSIIEYGDMPGDNPITGIEFTRNITISGMIGGTISGGLGTVCSGTNSTTLTLTGASGTVSRWESSDDNFLSNVQTVSNTTTTFNAINLTEKTFYRAVMVNGSCILPTPSTYINVLELESGVVSTESNEGCAGSAINLTLGGHKGTVTRWERTTNPVGSITSISSTSTSLSHTISTAGSYFLRVVVGNSSCSNSTQTEWYPVEIASAVAPTAGEVSSAAHCGSANNGTLTLKGSKGGSSYLWQQSTDEGITWTNAGSTTTRLTYNNVNKNTQYRVQVSKGACGSANSSVGEIIIYGTTISQWTGEGANDNWTTSANWCGGVIGTTGRRVAISEDALREPLLVANINLAELNFNASGRKVILDVYDISVDNIIGADSLNYFKTTGTGSLVKNIANSDSFKFAVGLSNYNPVTIVNKTGTADQFSVYVFDEVYERGSKGNGSAMSNKARIQATWEIGKASGSANAGSGVDFLFEWENSKRKGSISNPAVNHFNGSRNEWEFASNTSISRGRSNLRLIGYKGTFSPFAIGDGMTALPVDVVSFSAQGKVSTVQLSWITESEINHSHFVVMRSKDGNDWEEIGVVANNTNSQGLNQYEFIDANPHTNNYYQLKIVDNEGDSEFSDIRFVQLSIEKTLFVLTPNPTSGIVKIQTESHVADYKVYDISGKILHQGTLNKEIELVNLSSGIYFIKVLVDDKVEVKKLIVE